MAAKKKVDKNRLAIEGELTIYVAAELKEKIAALFGEDKDIDIDLAQVGEIDTAGLQLLLLARGEGERQKKAVTFTNPSDAVRDCWRLCNVSALFGSEFATAQ